MKLFKRKPKFAIQDAKAGDYARLDSGKLPTHLLFMFAKPGPDALSGELNKLIGQLPKFGLMVPGTECRLRVVVDDVPGATNFEKLTKLMHEWLEEDGNECKDYDFFKDGINAHIARYPFVQVMEAVPKANLDFGDAIQNIVDRAMGRDK